MNEEQSSYQDYISVGESFKRVLCGVLDEADFHGWHLEFDSYDGEPYLRGLYNTVTRQYDRISLWED